MNLLLLYLSVFFCLAIVSCTNSEKQELNGDGEAEEMLFEEKESYNAGLSMLNTDSIVFLTDLVKVNEKDVEDDVCDKWSLTEEQVNQVWPEMREADKGYEWYASCSQYPCSYKAKVKISETEFEITVNAGGYIWLFVPEAGSQVFILDKPSDYFLSVCNPELY